MRAVPPVCQRRGIRRGCRVHAAGGRVARLPGAFWLAGIGRRDAGRPPGRCSWCWRCASPLTRRVLRSSPAA